MTGNMNSELKHGWIASSTMEAWATGDKKIRPASVKKAMLKVAGWQLAHPKWPLYDWTSGVFCPRTITWWWCNTLFMAQN
jgi:hypothetical protein